MERAVAPTRAYSSRSNTSPSTTCSTKQWVGMVGVKGGPWRTSLGFMDLSGVANQKGDVPPWAQTAGPARSPRGPWAGWWWGGGALRPSGSPTSWPACARASAASSLACTSAYACTPPHPSTPLHTPPHPSTPHHIKAQARGVGPGGGGTARSPRGPPAPGPVPPRWPRGRPPTAGAQGQGGARRWGGRACTMRSPPGPPPATWWSLAHQREICVVDRGLPGAPRVLGS